MEYFASSPTSGGYDNIPEDSILQDISIKAVRTMKRVILGKDPVSKLCEYYQKKNIDFKHDFLHSESIQFEKKPFWHSTFAVPLFYPNPPSNELIELFQQILTSIE